MKFTATIAAVAVGVAAAGTFGEEVYQQAFEEYKAEHGKAYGAEMWKRYEAFKTNFDLVKEHNAQADMGMHTYRLAMNHLADLTAEEYRSMLSFKSTGAHPNARYTVGAGDAPDAVDLRDSGVVGPVKDQGQCGSCWSFSATAAMEGRYAMDSGSYVSLSEQELVDCTMDGEYTCTMGGEMHDGIEYIAKQQGGIQETEDNYDYTGKSKGTCYADSSKGPSDMHITGYSNVTQGDEDALKTAAAANVVSIGIDASEFAFQLYSGGVYSNSRCKNAYDELDHGVAIVGYGTDDGQDYWIVRNSWGPSWGEEGYIRMARNEDNMCGVATDACIALSD